MSVNDVTGPARFRPSAIVFDSSWLQAAGWPSAQKKEHVRVVALAHEAGVPLFFTELTRVELHHQMRKKSIELAAKFMAEQQNAKDTWEKATALGLSLGCECPTIVSADLAAWQERYGEAESAVIESQRLQLLPYPTGALADLADQSARHQPPFRDKDEGFRDGLNALSIAQHLQGDGEIVFLSNDKVSPSEFTFFRDAGIKYVIGLESLDLQALTDALEAMKGGVDPEQMKLMIETWASARQTIVDAALGQLGQLNKFVSGHLRIPRHIIDKVNGFRSIDGLELTSVRGALDTGEAHELVSGQTQEAEISFLVDVTVTVKTTPVVLRYANSYGIGDSTSRYQIEECAPRLETLSVEAYLTTMVHKDGDRFQITPTRVAAKEELVALVMNNELRRLGHIVEEE